MGCTMSSPVNPTDLQRDREREMEKIRDANRRQRQYARARGLPGWAYPMAPDPY